ncbi:carbohydrate-binding protein [Saccharopolyspora shandongensis]|uniref:carbohydrate-binding protein n=1 Tax=Saccharopolyspora shandongensis TaxID=418495 RepID=UPI0033E0379F
MAWVIYKAATNQLDEADKLASTGAFIIAALLAILQLRSSWLQPARGISAGHVDEEVEQRGREALDPAAVAANPPSPPAKPRRRARTLLVVASVVVVLVTVAVGFWTGRLGPIGGDSAGDGTEARGVPPGEIDAYSPIEAQQYTRAFPGLPLGTETLTDPVNGQKIPALGPIAPGVLSVLYRNVNFGPAFATKFQLTYQSGANADPNQKIELRLDDPNGPPIGEIPVQNSYHGGKAWRLGQSIAIPPTTGNHDVYLKFVHEDPNNQFVTTTPDDNAYITSFFFEI